LPAAILIFDLCSPHGSQKPLISALAVIFDHWLFKGTAGKHCQAAAAFSQYFSKRRRFYGSLDMSARRFLKHLQGNNASPPGQRRKDRASAEIP